MWSRFSQDSGQDVADDFSVDVCESEIATAVPVGKLFVIES